MIIKEITLRPFQHSKSLSDGLGMNDDIWQRGQLHNWTPRWSLSYLLLTPLLYFLSFFHLPRCTFPDSPSVSSQAFLPFLSCYRTTTACDARCYIQQLANLLGTERRTSRGSSRRARLVLLLDTLTWISSYSSNSVSLEETVHINIYNN